MKEFRIRIIQFSRENFDTFVLTEKMKDLKKSCLTENTSNQTNDVTKISQKSIDITSFQLYA